MVISLVLAIHRHTMLDAGVRWHLNSSFKIEFKMYVLNCTEILTLGSKVFWGRPWHWVPIQQKISGHIISPVHSALISLRNQFFFYAVCCCHLLSSNLINDVLSRITKLHTSLYRTYIHTILSFSLVLHTKENIRKGTSLSSRVRAMDWPSHLLSFNILFSQYLTNFFPFINTATE